MPERDDRQFVRRFAAYSLAYAIESGLHEDVDDRKIPVSVDDQKEGCLIVAKPSGADRLTLTAFREQGCNPGSLHKFVRLFVMRPTRYLRGHDLEWAGLLFCMTDDDEAPDLAHGAWFQERTSKAIVFDPLRYMNKLGCQDAAELALQLVDGWGTDPFIPDWSGELFQKLLRQPCWRRLSPIQKRQVSDAYTAKLQAP